MPYVHEAGDGIFSTIMNVVKDFSKDLGHNKSEKNRGVNAGALQRSSIMRASKDLVMSFPVLCSNTLSPQTASMIAKAVERNAVTTLQLLFSSAYLQGYSGQEVLKKWHNNIDNDMSMDEYLDIIDTVASKLDESAVLNESAIYTNEMIEECAHNNKVYPLSSFTNKSLCSYAVRESYDGDYSVRQSISEEFIRADGSRNTDGLIFDDVTGLYLGPDQFKATMDNRKLAQQSSQFAAQQQATAVSNVAQSARDRRSNQYQQDKLNLDKEKNAFDQTKFDYQRGKDSIDRSKKDMQDQFGYFRQQLLDNDVKKCNELVPSMIIVKFNALDPDTGRAATEQQFIAGVKSRLIPCDSFEIIDHIRSIEKNKISLVNLVRATTKEISFARDFVAGIDQAKIEAKQNSKLSRTSPIWRSLQARSTKSGLNRLKKGKANDAGAITTLVISQEEVNFLKKEYNIDLNIPAKAKFVMESYNLMGLVIVDESVEVARFLFDGEKYFQDYSFGSLERETGDSSYKKVINLISKINRG